MYVLVECLNQKSHNFATHAELSAFVLSQDTKTSGLVKDLLEVIAKHQPASHADVTASTSVATPTVAPVSATAPTTPASESITFPLVNGESMTITPPPPAIPAEQLKANARCQENPTKMTRTVVDAATGKSATITVYGGPPGPVSVDDAKKPAEAPSYIFNEYKKEEKTNLGPDAFDWTDNRYEEFKPVEPSKTSTVGRVGALSQPNPVAVDGYPDLHITSCTDGIADKVDQERFAKAYKAAGDILGVTTDSNVLKEQIFGSNLNVEFESPILTGKPFGEPSDNVEMAAVQHFLCSCFGLSTVGKGLSYRDPATRNKVKFAWMLFINHPEYFGDESASMYKLNIEGIKKLNKEDASKLNNTDALYRCWNNYICYNTQKLGFFLTLSKRLDESNWTKGRDTHSYMNNIQTNEIGDRFAFNNFGNLLYITSHLIASIADNTEKKKIHGIMSIPIRQAIVDMWVTFFASCNLRSGVSSMISSSDLFQTFTKWMEEFYEDVPGNEPGAERTNTEMELFRGLFRIQSFGSAVRTIGIETTRRSSGMFYKDVGYIVPKEGGEEGGADDGVSVKSVKSDKTAVSAKKISVFNSSELLPIEKAPDTKAMQQTVDKMMAERKVSVPSAIQTSEKALDALMKARDNVYNEALKPATPSVLKKIDAYIQHRDLSLASGDIRGDIPVAPLGEMTLKSFGLN